MQEGTIANPISTFDQPLSWKSFMFTLAEPNESPFKNMVMKLGPFYQLMNFLECIDATMNNSGLKDIIETIYGSNTIEHMISEKAISRAI